MNPFTTDAILYFIIADSNHQLQPKTNSHSFNVIEWLLIVLVIA